MVLLLSFTNLYDIQVKDINQNNINLSEFKGKKILFVNTSSRGNFSGQYKGLETLYQKYKDSLMIIAIPSNSFGNEPENNKKIKQYLRKNYQISFIVAEKSEVNGKAASPLYKWLTMRENNAVVTNNIKDDFFKFLVDGNGNLIGSFVSEVDPMNENIQKAIEN